MVNQQNITSVPGNATAGEYLYVVQFSSGTVKVGRTRSPASRLKKHAATARGHGITVLAQWISQEVANAPELERELIAHCSRHFTPLNTGEFFADAPIAEVLAFVATLEGATGGRLRMTQAATFALKGGRPAIGKKVDVRLDDQTVARVDARAEQEGVTRPEMLRRLIVAGL